MNFGRFILFFTASGFYRVKEGSGLLGYFIFKLFKFFFFLLSQLPVITTGKTYKQWALEVKLYMGKAAHCERAASEATD